jgi:hypothetical protein
MKVSELKAYAKKIGLKRFSRYKKNELQQLILDKEKNKEKISIQDYKLPLTTEQISKLKVSDMKKVLRNNGILIGIPSKKSELILLLQQNKCSPVNREFCDNDNICDIRNNICMSPDFKKRGLIKIKIDGKEIIGTKKAIDKLKEELEQPKQLEPLEDELDIIDLKEDEPDEDELKLDIIDLKEDEPVDIIELEDKHENMLNNLEVEKVLEEIEIPEKKENISNLSLVQKEVLKCLGMLP